MTLEKEKPNYLGSKNKQTKKKNLNNIRNLKPKHFKFLNCQMLAEIGGQRIFGLGLIWILSKEPNSYLKAKIFGFRPLFKIQYIHIDGFVSILILNFDFDFIHKFIRSGFYF